MLLLELVLMATGSGIVSGLSTTRNMQELMEEVEGHTTPSESDYDLSLGNGGSK